MEKNYLSKLFELAENNNVAYSVALETLENKVSQYIRRDEKNNKVVHYFNPLQQYHRAINVIEEYYKRKKIK